MPDNGFVGVLVIFVFVLALIAVIKVGLQKTAIRRQSSARSNDTDSVGWDNWEPSRHHSEHHDGRSSHHSGSHDGDSSSSNSSDGDSSSSDSSSGDSSSGDSGSSGGDSSSD